jgi:7,8-dihydropterin-6-yl-methyl-4-(beta-D-ribofuranosyl)aminobenzene 5'-phosphate synthase
MPIRLTILCDNAVAVPFGVLGEHGFACLVETDAGSYLFDTGQGLGIVANSLALGRDLRAIRAVLLSHGHYDHTGGLPQVLRLRGAVQVHGHPELFTPRFYGSGPQRRYIGVPFRRELLESLGAGFVLSREWSAVGPGLFLSGEVPRRTPFETGDAHMTAIGPSGETLRPDPLNDDLSLVVETGRGLVVVLGCAHAGLINILEHVCAMTGREAIHAVIGGTHLSSADEAQFEATVTALERFKVERLGVSHCTGLAGAARLYARLGQRFFFGAVGATLEA